MQMCTQVSGSPVIPKSAPLLDSLTVTFTLGLRRTVPHTESRQHPMVTITAATAAYPEFYRFNTTCQTAY
jgi:hypothetical protein